MAPDGQQVAGLTFLTGLYLAISPWVVGFNRFPTLTVNNLIVGLALALLALGFGSATAGPRHRLGHPGDRRMDDHRCLGGQRPRRHHGDDQRGDRRHRPAPRTGRDLLGRSLGPITLGAMPFTGGSRATRLPPQARTVAR
ncbi:SPW repeat protein [Sphaerisporangium perillae]|uniref:SPW repeat protein n=1 Tax=Sphaerisporangium perillae TaxID=2935860 RepID=UPI003FD8059C